MTTPPKTLITELALRLREQAKRFNPAMETAPVAVLWTDDRSDWEGALPKLKAGQIKLLGSTLRERHPLFREIPSLHEQGVTGYDVDLWLGVWGPANMPADVLAKVNAELRAIVALPEIRDQLAGQGLVPNTSTPEQFSKIVKDDHARWAKVVRDAGIKAD